QVAADRHGPFAPGEEGRGAALIATWGRRIKANRKRRRAGGVSPLLLAQTGGSRPPLAAYFASALSRYAPTLSAHILPWARRPLALRWMPAPLLSRLSPPSVS